MIHILPGWIRNQDPTYPAMFRKVCHLAKHVQVLLAYDSWTWFHRSCRRKAVNPNSLIVKNIVPLQRPICIRRRCHDGCCISETMPFHRGTTFGYRLVVGVARYSGKLEYSGSRLEFCSCDDGQESYANKTGTCFPMWRTCLNIRYMWDDEVAAFCRYKELRLWLEYAKDKALSTISAWPKAKRFVYMFFWFTACAQNGPATRRPGFDLICGIQRLLWNVVESFCALIQEEQYVVPYC